MKLYFSTKNIPKLANMPLTERLTKMREAEGKLTPPEKFLLNLLKLAIFIPAFVLILRSAENFSALLWAALVFALYPLLLRPLQYGLCVKYLKAEENT